MEGTPMRIATRTFVLALAALALVAGEAQAKPTPEQSCQKALSLAAGTYLQCMEKAMGTYYGGVGPLAGPVVDPTDYVGKVGPALGKCVDTYTANWPKLVKKYDGQGTSCTGDRYADNGDGTFADRLTSLVWEKKTGTPGGTANPSDPHDVNNAYSWSTGSLVKEDGTAFTTFLNTLNDGGFGGSNGWRLPSFYELNTLVAPGFPNCSVTPCTTVPGETVSGGYWSSSTDRYGPDLAWSVYFTNGGVYGYFKTDGSYVRAVRGGS